MSGQPASLGSPILARLNTVALYVAGFGLILMTAIVAWQVFGRKILNDSPFWTEVTTIMVMNWFIFLGAAVGVRENNHMGFDVLLYVLPPAAKKWLRMISDIVIFFFGCGMVWFGVKQVIDNWGATKPILGIPEGITYLPLAAGGVLVTLFALERIVLRAKGAPIDEALDDMAPPEVAVELESLDDVRKDAEQIGADDAAGKRG